jgi:hypothetical protein
MRSGRGRDRVDIDASRRHFRKMPWTCLRASCLAGLYLVLAACHEPSGGARATAPTVATLNGATAFQAVCLLCHDEGDDSRPALSSPHLTRAAASTALRALASYDMPPPSAGRIDGETRAAILAYLCPRSGRNATACGVLLAREAAPALVRPPTNFFGQLPRLPGVRAEHVSPELRGSLLGQLTPRSPQALLDGSVVARHLAIAEAACARPPAVPVAPGTPAPGPDQAAHQAPRSQVAVRACMAAVLELALTPSWSPDAATGRR